MFQTLGIWFNRWRSIFELRLIDRRYSNEYESFFHEQIALAEQAVDGGDPKRALKIWHEMRGPFRRKAARSPPALRLLLKLGAFDELDDLMQEGLRLDPQLEHFAQGYVQVAQKRGDLREAVRRCEIARKKFPHLADGYSVAAECLIELERPEEAEALMERAVHKIPSALHVLTTYARLAERRKDWEEALRRWEPVRSQFDHIYGHNGVAECLRRLGRLDEAEKVAIEACDRFPTEPWAFAILAAIAADRGDLDEACRRWDNARRRRPHFHYAYKAGAEAERRAGREDKADEILATGVAMVRGDLDLHLQYAQNAHRRRDWRVAAERWALVRKRFPDCAEARKGEAEALAVCDPTGRASV